MQHKKNYVCVSLKGSLDRTPNTKLIVNILTFFSRSPSLKQESVRYAFTKKKKKKKKLSSEIFIDYKTLKMHKTFTNILTMFILHLL